jgi:hypothetical protein
MQALTVGRASFDLLRLGVLVMALAAALALTGEARAGGVTVSGEDETIAPSSAVEFTVSGHSETPIGAFGIDILFDETKLVAHSCQSNLAICNRAAQPGRLRLNGVSLVGFSGDITFVTVIFQAVGAQGVLPVDIDVTALASVDLTDMKGDAIVSDGSVTIDDGGALTPPGDANCDSILSAGDGLAIVGNLAGTDSPDCLPVADVNCDGKVDVLDALTILRAVAGLPLSLPPGCEALA